MSDAEWHKYWAVNVHGLFYCTRAALRRMEPRRYGRIVNIASIAGMSMFDDYLEKIGEEVRNRLFQLIPTGRLGTMDEYAELVLYLSGDKHYLDGQTISPTGGMF
ncbi:MAG: SDR family oxidoreductase [Sphingorhabdus sp.]|uniref:SDR family oxidoreductase n=1 Tax=Sphingorhabdus sp. TaxID=1902408 RepID=UPI003CA74E00